jgi:hypothetical protein
MNQFLKSQRTYSSLKSRGFDGLALAFQIASRARHSTTVVPIDHAWRMVHPVECHSKPTSMIATDSSVDYSVLEDQLHNLERELRDALVLKYAEFADSQNCLRRRLEEARTREEKL